MNLSVEHVLMFALVMFIFYHFMCRCNRVEGLTECGQALQDRCGHTAGSGSCKDCNECLSKYWEDFNRAGCTEKSFNEFCSLPEQQQENTLYLFNDGKLKDDGKAKLMEILREYTIGRQRGDNKDFKLKFGISNGSDIIIADVANFLIDADPENGGNTIKILGTVSKYSGGDFKYYDTFNLEYTLPNDEYFVIQLYDNNINDYLIDITALRDPKTKDSVKVLDGYSIKFSYYLC